MRAVEIPVLELEHDQNRLVQSLADEAQLAVEQDGAHVMIFGCTGMIGAAQAVEEELAARGYPDVPVIDSMVWAVKHGRSDGRHGPAAQQAVVAVPAGEADRGLRLRAAAATRGRLARRRTISDATECGQGRRGISMAAARSKGSIDGRERRANPDERTGQPQAG